jgi:radical SAM protein with 4Fe4S-binding SPASM domain
MQRMMDGKILTQRHAYQHYTTFFDQNTGFFVRKEDKGYGEPFWSEDGPELLDVSITNYCESSCKFCYRQSNPKGKHMSLSNLQYIVDQAEDIGVLQIALGGGNPNQHPKFLDILKIIRTHNIIPSYTTNGDGLTHDILKATSDYCGAMALSYYPSKRQDYTQILKKTNEYHIKTNLHLILKSDTIDFATKCLVNPPEFLKYVNAIIFLNYKPVNNQQDLSINNQVKVEAFFRAASECKSFKIGFDSCSISGIARWMNVYPCFIESCEAGRFSAFISEEMRMFPCSFMANTTSFGDLHKQSILDVWKKNDAFVNQRHIVIDNHCKSCDYFKVCHGGCRFIPEINFCKNNI